MSELTITALRLGFVLALWLFVFVTVAVLRSDLFGSAVIPRGEKKARSGRGREKDEPDRPASHQNHQSDDASAARDLVVTAGPLRGTVLHLGNVPVLIGRSPECTLVLDDDYASNRHARIFGDGGRWSVEDLGSTNGTQLSGRRITGPVPFPVGATLRIGRTDIEMRRRPR